MHRSIITLGALALFASIVAAADPKPQPQVIMNKSKDIHVVSDRKETIVEFFRRSHLVLGVQTPEEALKTAEAKEERDGVFINYAAFNDDPDRDSLQGTKIKVAPPSAEVKKLLAAHKPDPKKAAGQIFIFRREAGVYHVVGMTERSSIGFFALEEKNKTDGFSQHDLIFEK